MNKGYIISGTLFGDEGKGTFVDYVAESQEIKQNVRYNGGSHARHTVIKGSTSHKFSQLGSSMLKEGNKTYLSKNTIVNLFSLYEEAMQFSIKTGKSFESIIQSVYIDKNAYVVTPYHAMLNMIEELFLKENRRGSVGNGVSFTRKLLIEENIGLQISDLMDMEGKGSEKIEELFKYTCKYLKNHISFINLDLLNANIAKEDIFYLTDKSNKNYIETCYRNLMKHCDFNIVNDIKEFYTLSDDILFEGSQGLLIDSVYGIRPNTTLLDTSNHYAKVICEEIKYSPISIGASRAFASRHGKGILPTFDKKLSSLIKDENQMTSFWNGSPIYGWYDALLMRYSQNVSENDELYLSCVDQLSDFKIIKICNSYIYRGECTEDFDETFKYYKDNSKIIITDIKKNNINLKSYLEKCIPAYIEIKGWMKDIGNIKNYEDLPKECHDFIELIESAVQVDISLIGVGAQRECKIRRLKK